MSTLVPRVFRDFDGWYGGQFTLQERTSKVRKRILASGLRSFDGQRNSRWSGSPLTTNSFSKTQGSRATRRRGCVME